MRRILFSCFIFLLFYSFSFLSCLTAGRSFAQESWVVNSFDSKIEVQNSGIVQVQEAINVDFGNLEKHGIFRDIPVSYSSDKEGEYVYSKVTVSSVLLNNQNVPYDLIPSGAYLRIKIGDPNKTISGKNSYVISYGTEGILSSYEGYDELYFNVTGNGWDVPIQNSSATVTLPKPEILKATCYQGPSGSKVECKHKITDSITAQFNATQNLTPGSGLTIVVGYTPGIVPILTVSEPQYPLDSGGVTSNQEFFTLPNFLAFLVPIVLSFLFVFNKWRTTGRDFWFKRLHPFDKNATEETMPYFEKETTVVEFEPPNNLRPAEIGVIMDEKADTLDVTATIVDLAGRGFLTISEIDKKWILGTIDYEFKELKKEKNELLAYEKELLKRLFEDKDKIKLSEIKTKFYKHLAEVKKLLYEHMETRKLFAGNPEKVRNSYLTGGILLIVLGGFGLFFLGFSFYFLAFLFVGILLSGVLFLAFSRFMPRRTALGRDLYARVKGYEMFLGSAEKYRQQFFERKNMFNEILPYTIVFGVTAKFAQAFKELGLKAPSPTWYHGSRAFNAYAFGSHMNTFSHAVSQSIQAAPRSSGFSSSGGGGGGSW